MPKIHFTTPDDKVFEFELTKERARIGRSDENDFVLPDSSVSSRHADFVLNDGSLEITDLGSTNGTFFGGERVERAFVPPGGTFRLGNVQGMLEGVEHQAEENSDASEQNNADDTKDGGQSFSAGMAVISGLGATPCPVELRSGFGPKEKKKDRTASLIMAIAAIALILCTIAALMIYTMGA